MKHHASKGACCGRPFDEKDILRDAAGLDAIEDTVLTIARHYFQSFAVPQSQAWMNAINLAEQAFGRQDGGQIAARVMSVLRAMRGARRSTFMFNSPGCKGCSAVLSEHERRLIGAFAALRRGALGQARVEAMMLCEGNATDALIYEMRALSAALPAPPQIQGRNGYVSISY